MSNALVPIEVFCSYTHEDEAHLRELKAHLRMLERQGLISTWHDRQIMPGADWAQAIDTHLETASLILLLVSADFLASDYCYETEMQRAIERHEVGRALVLPIIVRPCDWTNTPFAKLQCLPRDGKPVTRRRNKDAVWNDVAAGVRRAIEDLPLFVASVPRAILPPVWNIPYPRNPFFIGRDDLLSRLHIQLQAGQITALSQPQAISGLGGIGKTQMAVEYAYRYHQEYEAVLWASAENQEALVSSYSRIADLLKLPEREAPEQEITIQAVKRWLQVNQKWLLILDNADDLELIPSFLPPVQSGHLLLTTRVQATGQLARRIEVETLLAEQGALLLLRRATLIAPDASLEQVSPEDRELAMQITRELGGLPLALDQAGAYIEETRCDLAGYLDLYRLRRTELLDRRGKASFSHPESVTTTFSLCFDKVRQASTAAIELLKVCVFLSPDAIPEEIITKGALDLGRILGSTANSPMKLNTVITELLRFSLVYRDPDGKHLIVHRLVQSVLVSRMDKRSRRIWAERAIRAVNLAFPDVVYEVWKQCLRYLPHVRVCQKLIEQYEFAFPEAARLLHEAGTYLTERAEYVEAEALLRQALTIREQVLGHDHLDTASTLNALGILYLAHDKHELAEPLLHRALDIRKQALGHGHPDTAHALSNLAIIHEKHDNDEQAEHIFQQVLTIRQRVLGPNHPSTASSLNNLAVLYSKRDENELAESYFQQALVVREQALGPNHPDTASSLENLAIIYSKCGKDELAEPLLQRALVIRVWVFGSDHPDTVGSFENLVDLYKKGGNGKTDQSSIQRARTFLDKILEVKRSGGEPPIQRVSTDASPAHDPQVTQKRKPVSDQPRDKSALMECSEAGAIRDEELLAYMDGGWVRSSVRTHIAGCQYCSSQLATYRRMARKLIQTLYRWDCPPNQVLGEYQLGLLSREHATGVQDHLQRCALCTADVVILTNFLANDSLIVKPLPISQQVTAHLVEKWRTEEGATARRVVARLLTEQPRLAYQRDIVDSTDQWPRRYSAESFTISIQVERTPQYAHQGSSLQLLGFVICDGKTLEELQGTSVLLSSLTKIEDECDQSFYSQMVDELGNFLFTALEPDTYMLELQLSGSTIVIEQLYLGTLRNQPLANQMSKSDEGEVSKGTDEIDQPTHNSYQGLYAFEYKDKVSLAQQIRQSIQQYLFTGVTVLVILLLVLVLIFRKARFKRT